MVCFYFDSDLIEALKRNSQREANAKIPEQGVRATYRKMVTPILTEGFSTIYTVKIIQNQQFSIHVLTQSDKV